MTKRSLKPPRRKPAMARRGCGRRRRPGHAQGSDRGAIHCAAAAGETCGVLQTRFRRRAGAAAPFHRGRDNARRVCPCRGQVQTGRPARQSRLDPGPAQAGERAAGDHSRLAEASYDTLSLTETTDSARTSRSARCGCRAVRATAAAQAFRSRRRRGCERGYDDCAEAELRARGEPKARAFWDAGHRRIQRRAPLQRTAHVPGDRAETARPGFGELSFRTRQGARSHAGNPPKRCAARQSPPPLFK